MAYLMSFTLLKICRIRDAEEKLNSDNGTLLKSGCRKCNNSLKLQCSLIIPMIEAGFSRKKIPPPPD